MHFVVSRNPNTEENTPSGAQNRKRVGSYILHWCEYSTNALERLGTLLSRADHLRRASISVKNEGDEEIGLVLRGPYQQHSLKTFSLHGFDTRELPAG